MADPYFTLGINERVSDEDVAAAYHRQLRRFPPEEHPERFAAISEAYETIRSEENRLDARLFGPVPAPNRVSELAEHEEPELPSMGLEEWLKIATASWLAGRIS